MKIANISIKHPVFAAALNLVFVLFGIVAYNNVGVDLFPQVDVPVVTVRVVYPGADPTAVESKVMDKLEEAFNTISGIDKLKSVSLENGGMVIIEFVLERDIDVAAQDVRDKLATVIPDLPEDIDTPVVEKFDVGSAPILVVSLSSETASLREVSRVADDVIKTKLETISGVGSIEIAGRRERQMHVWVDRDRLASYGLAVTDLAQALAAQNLDVPSGRIDIGPEELMVKTKGEAFTAEELGAIVVTSKGGAPIRVRDLARVEDGEEEARSFSSLNGATSVALVVQKQSDANTVAVAEAVKAEVQKLTKSLPEGMKMDIPVDNSTFIAASMHDVRFDMLFGGILTVLIIMVFLRDLRATIIAAVALPTSVIATVAFISAMGFTFNNMTMLALTLSVGILIDDAIVVIENIHRHLEMGKTPMQAAGEATAEIGLAVMAITASILAVFVPVALMDGIVGRFFFQFGMTVAFAVAISLLVSFTLTPMLSSRILKLSHGKPNAIYQLIEKVLVWNEESYRTILRWVVGHRLVTFLIATAAFIGAFMLLGQVKSEFMPEADNGEMNIVFELPPGRNLEETKAFAEMLSERVKDLPGLESLLIRIGDGSDGQVYKGSIHVGMVDKHGRSFTTVEAMDWARAAVGKHPPARVSVERASVMQSGASNKPLQYNLRSNNPEALDKAVDGMMTEMAKIPGLVDLETSLRDGMPEVRVSIDRGRAAELGVPVAVVAQSLRLLVAGDKVTDIPNPGGDRIDVWVRMKDSERKSMADLTRVKVRGASGQLVELGSFITVERGTGPSRIDRQARQRQVTLFANLEGRVLGDVMGEVEAIAKRVVPEDVTQEWAGSAEMSGDAAASMGKAMILAVGLIYLLLASQFNSWIHPFTIMLSLPLSFVGAFGAMWLTGSTMNVFSMVGLIMLMGLVIKNAVLLIDYALTLQREQGMGVVESIVAAGPIRLRPILMTSAAMIFGMVPVALGESLGGEMRAPMAIAVIGGLISSTFLTLLVVPVVYLTLDKVASFFVRKAPEAEPVAHKA